MKTAQGLLKNPPARLEATQPQATETVQSGEGFAQSSPGQLVTWVMTTLFGVAGFLVYERINGTARRLAVMPMRNSIILGGNFAGRFALGAVQMILMVGFGALVLSVPYGNDPLALAVMLITFGLAGTAFGMMLGTFSRTHESGRRPVDLVCDVVRGAGRLLVAAGDHAADLSDAGEGAAFDVGHAGA